MRILLANLKHLYQRPSFWVIHVILGMGLVISAVLATKRVVHPTLLLPLFVYVTGRFAGTLQVEILARPFAYCLPGHARVPRRFLSVWGWCIALACAAVAALYPAGHWSRALHGTVSTCFLSSISYWLGVSGAFSFRGVLTGLVPLAVVFGSAWGGAEAFTRGLIEGWVFIMALGCVVNIAAWRLLKEDGLARRYCDRREWLRRRAEVQPARKGVEDSQIKPGVEQFFLGRVSSGCGTPRYVWGNLYRAGAGRLLSRKIGEWLMIGFLAAVVLCGLGYIQMTDMLFIFPAMWAWQVRLGVYSGMLISGGRRERFWSTLVLAGIYMLYVMAMLMLLAGISALLEQVMPPLKLGIHSVVYTPMDFRFLLVPLAFIPVVMALALISQEHRRLIAGAVMTFLALLFLLPKSPLVVHLICSAMARPALLAMVSIIGSWLILAAVLRYICMRRCLVR